MRWRVEYERQVKAEIARQLRSGAMTTDDLHALRDWVNAILELGLVSVQTDKWSDHPLEAEWKGHRAAAFSKSGRVIYRVEDGRLIVTVVRVTATHSYRR